MLPILNLVSLGTPGALDLVPETLGFGLINTSLGLKNTRIGFRDIRFGLRNTDFDPPQSLNPELEPKSVSLRLNLVSLGVP